MAFHRIRTDWLEYGIPIDMGSFQEKFHSALVKDLPDYTVGAVLGTGSSSTVYRATQKALGRDVAIKRFAHEAFPASSVVAKRFEREAAMWAHFSHENLIHLYDYRSTPSARYIILEFCHGVELRSLLDRMITLPIKVVICLAHQILSAMEYLHRYGIVHRDIKPGNLFVTSDGVVKLMDFGISLCPELEPMTLPGNVMGTPAYMSPEQALGKDVDARSDIYSLGVMMYEMLEGFRPFRSLDVKDLLLEIQTGKYAKLSLRHPQSIRNLVHSCIRKNPARRPKSASKMRQPIEKHMRRLKVLVPREMVQSHLIEQGLTSGVAPLFPKGVTEKTAKSPLAPTYAEVQSPLRQNVPTSRKGRFRLSLRMVVGLLFLLGLLSIGPFWKEWKKSGAWGKQFVTKTLRTISKNK